MSTTANEGLFPGNYEDYGSDDVAKQREIDLLPTILDENGDIDKDIPCDTPWEDTAFPSDGRSLYFDPLNPTKGSIPSSVIMWKRICANELKDCEQPKYFFNNSMSAEISQGALGNSYFINSLRLCAAASLATPELDIISRLLVSDKHADRGIYTFKFFKSGSWRYVHIDDKIPCRQSGEVNFCRNRNKNETFAMLLEKAYAKLHGCYEALSYGSIGKALMDFFPGSYIATVKSEHFKLNEICDKMWTKLENGLNYDGKVMIGCCRKVDDAVYEKPSQRKGITLNFMYQVVRIEEVSCQATELLNGLTVGMVCLRNLQCVSPGVRQLTQGNLGRYVGRWSFGHRLWADYPAIGRILRQKTREIQWQRGMGIKPLADSADGDFPYERSSGGGGIAIATGGPAKVDAPAGDIMGYSLQYLESLSDTGSYEMLPASSFAAEAIQPRVEDLFWMQIEDFVEIFNRVYILDGDLSFDRKVVSKKFLSQWIPGDDVAGSDGPPFHFPESETSGDDVQVNYDHLAIMDLESVESGTISEKQILNYDKDGTDVSLVTHSMHDDQSIEDLGSVVSDATPIKTTASGDIIPAEDVADVSQLEDLESKLSIHQSLGSMGSAASVEKSFGGKKKFENTIQESFDYLYGGHAHGVIFDATPNTANTDFVGINGVSRNAEFLNSPMYPFVVNEVSRINIILYQADRRWSVMRLGDNPREISANEFAVRGERLASCMRYPVAVGFIIVKLSGHNMRMNEYRNRKVVACSDWVEFSPSASATFTLRAGRYAVIPYSHIPLDRSMSYVLHFQYLSGQVDIEIEDLLKERPDDANPSDNEDDTDVDEHIIRKKRPQIEVNEDEDRLDEEDEEAADARRAAIALAKLDERVFPPLLLVFYGNINHLYSGISTSSEAEWEWREDSSGEAFACVFEEVSELCEILAELRQEIKLLKNDVL